MGWVPWFGSVQPSEPCRVGCDRHGSPFGMSHGTREKTCSVTCIVCGTSSAALPIAAGEGASLIGSYAAGVCGQHEGALAVAGDSAFEFVEELPDLVVVAGCGED